MAPISIRKDESGFSWIVRYACCETPRTKLHEWQVARRIAFGHKCPDPFPTVTFDRPKRLTRSVR